MFFVSPFASHKIIFSFDPTQHQHSRSLIVCEKKSVFTNSYTGKTPIARIKRQSQPFCMRFFCFWIASVVYFGLTYSHFAIWIAHGNFSSIFFCSGGFRMIEWRSFLLLAFIQKIFYVLFRFKMSENRIIKKIVRKTEQLTEILLGLIPSVRCTCTYENKGGQT